MNTLRHETRAVLRGLAFISPWLIGFLAFTAVPIGLSLFYSFCDYSLLQPPLFKGWDNYRMLWQDPVFWKVLRNTAVYGLLALPLGMAAALGVAMLLNSKIKGVSIYRTLVFLPSLVPIVASAMLWLWLFNAKLGLINTALGRLGVANPPGWLTDVRWAMPAIVIIG